MSWDRALFHWINGWPESPAPLFVFLSDGIKGTPLRLVLLALVVAMVARGPRSRATIVQALLAWPLANGMTDVLKAVFKLPRPCVELADAILRTDALTSFGTASAHSANMAAVATVWCLRLGPKWGAIWVAVAILTGISRIYVGVHYPYQVLLGWTCGILAGLAVTYVWNKFGPKFKVLGPKPTAPES